jgi:heat shock protein HtpX
MRVMGLADMSSRLTKMLSWLGQLYLLFSLPLIIFGQTTISVLPVLLLIAAPLLSV